MSSFSNQVKNEITVIDEAVNKKELLRGLLQINATISFTSEGLTLKFKTKNINIVNLLADLIYEFYKTESTVLSSQEKRLNKETIYMLEVNQNASYIIRDLKIVEAKEDISYSLKKEISSEDERASYLRGAFLACGSINDPKSLTYHMEIQTFNMMVATNLRDLMNTFGLNAKLSKNRRGYIVYLKKAETISDFIRIIGASESVMEFENLRIEKDLSNSINRIMNCEIANQRKTEESARRQIDEINYLMSHNIELKPGLKDVANLRLKYPDDSLTELSVKSEEELEKPISRNTVIHRLREIHEIFVNNSASQE